MMSDGLLDGDRIRAHLAEVAAALPVGRPPHRLILVGGSLLAWHGLRGTRPLAQRPRPALRAADASRAGLRSLGRPATALRILGAPFDQVFLMKLYATRVRTSDVEDMVALWPRTGFAPADQAVELYYQAYPLAEVDPFLTAYVADLTGAPEHAEPPPG